MLVGLASDCPGIHVDAGTGAGSTLDVFPRSARVIGMDASLRMITSAALKRPLTGVVGDIRRLPFRARSVRFLSIIGVLEYLPDIHAFLDEAECILAEDGCMLATISRPGPLNGLRRLLGHPLYPIRLQAWETMLRSYPFRCIRRTESMLQIQFLYRKETEPPCAR
jgi:ubiquinone/menaquinone biosynthesis C-methylase UbiE